MTVARAEKRVGDLGARADGLVGRMEAVAGRYLEALAPWVGERFEADVAAAVAGAPEITQDLGEGLSHLRMALRALVAGVPDLVRRRVGTRGAWPHRWDRGTAGLAEGLYGAKAGSTWEVAVPGFLHRRLLLLLGTSGHLLSRHGYEAYVRRTWDRAYVRSDYFPPEYLARGLDGHERFHPFLAEYGDLCDEYARIVADLRSAASDRSTRSAQDLWKRA